MKIYPDKIKKYNFGSTQLYHCDFNLNWFRVFFDKPIKTIFEFGSWDAGDAIRYKFFTGADVYSFEANPEQYKLIKPLEVFGINFYNYAIYNKCGVKNFYTCNHVEGYPEGASSLLNVTQRAIDTFDHLRYSKTSIPVKTITIEKFCNEHNITEIDYMHIDVEGVGKEVIQGFGKIRPKLILIEIAGVVNYFYGASNQKEIDDLLKDYIRIDCGIIHDSLYVRKDIKINKDKFYDNVIDLDLSDVKLPDNYYRVKEIKENNEKEIIKLNDIKKQLIEINNEKEKLIIEKENMKYELADLKCQKERLNELICSKNEYLSKLSRDDVDILSSQKTIGFK